MKGGILKHLFLNIPSLSTSDKWAHLFFEYLDYDKGEYLIDYLSSADAIFNSPRYIRRRDPKVLRAKFLNPIFQDDFFRAWIAKLTIDNQAPKLLKTYINCLYVLVGNYINSPNNYTDLRLMVANNQFVSKAEYLKTVAVPGLELKEAILALSNVMIMANKIAKQV